MFYWFYRKGPSGQVLTPIYKRQVIELDSAWPSQMDHIFLPLLKVMKTGANLVKLFTAVSCKFQQEARALVPGKPFQPSLMFVGNARRPPQSGAPERCFTQVGSGLTCKQLTKLKRFARNKCSSFLQKFVTYDRKKFYNIAPRSL